MLVSFGDPGIHAQQTPHKRLLQVATVLTERTVISTPSLSHKVKSPAS